MQIINLFVDRSLKYLNTAIVWTGTNVFRMTKKQVKNKKKKESGPTQKENKKDSEETEKEPTKGSKQSTAIYEGFNVIEPKDGDYNKFKERIHNNKSLIGIILGARGTGKSAIGLKILENIHAQTDRPVAALGFNAKDMPSWLTCIEEIDQIENGSFVLVDEGGILFSSRSSMSEPNKLLSEILLVARHKDLSVLFITQNSSNLEINTIRQADYMILKPSSLLQRDFERKKIRDIYDGAKEEFKKYKDDKGLAYIYANNFHGFISNPLPSFWSDQVSKAFSKK